VKIVPTLSPKAGEKGRAPTGKSDAKSQTERAGHPPVTFFLGAPLLITKLRYREGVKDAKTSRTA